jgi:hypothetical protein
MCGHPWWRHSREDTVMKTNDVGSALAGLFTELVDGVAAGRFAFILNSGDAGLLGALDRLTPEEASHSIGGGATVAAHVEHLRYGLSLMNRWAREGGNPFADATWDAAWRISAVDAAGWDDIRGGLRDEARRWREALGTPRDVGAAELTGMIASVAHLAYHLGAIRQISARARGPREGTS